MKDEAVVVPVSEHEAAYWVVRAESGRFTPHFVRSGIVAIGWEELGDFRTLDREELRAKIAATYGSHPQSVAITTGQLWRFVHDVSEGDYVLTPNHAAGTHLVGQVVSPALWEEKSADECYPTRRRVKWVAEIEKADMTAPLRLSLNSSLTVFGLATHKSELATLLGSAPEPSAVSADADVYSALIGKFMQMTPQGFEVFVTQVLQTVGFDAETTQLVADGGKDIVGVMNVGGVLEVPVKVQVKRQKGNVGPDVVNSLRGVLRQDEFGIFVTSSEFTKAAKKAASDAGLKTIWLVDGTDLCRLILDNFDSLDEEMKDRLKLKRVFRVE